MWLLNVRTLQLEEFLGSWIPKYAILSHTWGVEEVTFEDMKSGGEIKKAGYAKVKGCCSLAKENGYRYCWIDTCCIDKSSSAELSEAINSMFRWYQMSAVCYVYLSDVPFWRPGAFESHPDNIELQDAFKNSRWFTRGWTLQELIAPRRLIFYANDWSEMGTKGDLTARLEEITGIPTEALRHATSLQSYNVATRMSWAAKRNTTREEDVAYCLFGIFNINLPLLYGEGAKAFLRLQEEIVRTIEDFSIFAWADPATSRHIPCGFLAASPSCFGKLLLPEAALSHIDISDVFGISPHRSVFELLSGKPPNDTDFDPPFSTSRGIKLTLSLKESSQDKAIAGMATRALLILHCSFTVRTLAGDEQYVLAMQATQQPGSLSYKRSTPSAKALTWISTKLPLEYRQKTVYLCPSAPSAKRIPQSVLRTVVQTLYGGQSSLESHIEGEWV